MKGRSANCVEVSFGMQMRLVLEFNDVTLRILTQYVSLVDMSYYAIHIQMSSFKLTYLL